MDGILKSEKERLYEIRICLKLIGIWLNEHPNEKIIERVGKEGRREVDIVRVPTEREWKAIFDWLDGVKERGEQE